MVVTLGQQNNVGEKPTVIMYTYYINRHAEPPNTTKHNSYIRISVVIEPYKNRGAWVNSKLSGRDRPNNIVILYN